MNAYRRIGVQALLRIGYRRNSKGGIVSIHHRSVTIALLSLCLAAPGQWPHNRTRIRARG
jgi:hypothetical protein